MFESNSSSSHSFAIDDSVSTYDSITPDEDGNIILEGGQFGWEWRRYTDALTKANYCAVDIQGDYNKEYLLKKIIKDHTGAKDVIFDFSDEWDSANHSYIDHEGHGTTYELFSSEEYLKNFIFGGGVLFTGNDNDTAPFNFYDIKTEYVNQLYLEGSYNKLKLTKSDLYSNETIEKALEISFNHNKYNEYDSKFNYSLDKVDFDKNILIIKNTEPEYKVDSITGKREYVGQKLIGTKNLKWEIQPL